VFIGHFAVGFASKHFAPKASLAPLLAAPLFLDLLWPIGLLTGLESVRIDPGNTAVTPLDLHDYPYTHSLAMALLWAALFAGGMWLALRSVRASLAVGLGVFSHWILDFVTHRPDMPLFPGSATYVGLGLWNSKPATAIVESAMFAAGVWLYLRATRAKNRTGTAALWAMVVLLSAMYGAVLFGPPPPSVTAIAVGGLSAWLFVLWAWWIDRNRTPAAGEPRSIAPRT